MTEPPQRRVNYGGRQAAVLERDWPVAPPQPYRKAFRLRPGDHWRDAERSTTLRERYAIIDGEVVPVAVAIARELVSQGATWAFAAQVWAGRVVLIGPDLVCAAPDGAVGELLDALSQRHGGLDGLPRVLGGTADGGVLLREASDVGSRDRIGPKQHEFARAAFELLGPRLDLAVVEWGSAHAPGVARSA